MSKLKQRLCDNTTLCLAPSLSLFHRCTLSKRSHTHTCTHKALLLTKHTYIKSVPTNWAFLNTECSYTQSVPTHTHRAFPHTHTERSYMHTAFVHTERSYTQSLPTHERSYTQNFPPHRQETKSWVLMTALLEAFFFDIYVAFEQ